MLNDKQKAVPAWSASETAHNSNGFNLSENHHFVNPIPKGRIENGVLIKKVRAENYHRKLRGWGVSQAVLESALEQGAEYVEFRIDGDRRLRGRILDALNYGIRHQFDDYEPQVFLTNGLLRPVEDSQLSLFSTEGVKP